MAFRWASSFRAALWAGGTFRGPTEHRECGVSSPVKFGSPQRRWRSPRTGVDIRRDLLSLGDEEYALEPLMDVSGARFACKHAPLLEGAVRALRGGREVGRGYLVLTGYWKPLKL